MTARRALRALLLVLVSGASFALVASVLRPLVPWPEERGLRAKFEYVRDHRDEIDAIYVGSSAGAIHGQPLVVMVVAGNYHASAHHVEGVPQHCGIGVIAVIA